jgi:TRAP-type mannitol/chloroaromatic compound transport system permease small subunit
MQAWLAAARRIDRLSEWVGRVAGWGVLAMILIGAYNALARYLGRFAGWNLSSNLYIELQWYLFSVVFLLGAANTLRRGGHVRVDVLYGRLSLRLRAWVDLLGTLVFLLPFSLFSLWLCWPSVRNSWAVRELSPDPGGLARYPIKTVILLAFTLLFLQGVSEAIKLLAVLRQGGSSNE